MSDGTNEPHGRKLRAVVWASIAIGALVIASVVLIPRIEKVPKDNTITFAFGFYFEIGGSHIKWRMPTSM